MQGRIVFFSIPAHGHTNPTLEVVRRLTQRGHAVRYYSFEMLREKITAAGAEFMPCDAHLPPLPRGFERRAKYDFASLIEMATHVTLSMEADVCRELAEFKPDCIVADSMCLWGKLYAKRLGIPMVCSTTSFAFNEHTAGLMKPGFLEMCHMIGGMPRIDRYMAQLRRRGYAVQNLQQLIQNDNETETIVYTSRAFQPMSETFGDSYAFVGPSIPEEVPEGGTMVPEGFPEGGTKVPEGFPEGGTKVPEDFPVGGSKAPEGFHAGGSKAPEGFPGIARKVRPLVYVSLGTVIRDVGFFRACIAALRDQPLDVVMSVGDERNVARLRGAPDSFQIRASVPQLQVLRNADVFITHCGMNSVNESLLFEVPMVMFPQHSEQRAVAHRAAEVGAGVISKAARPGDIRDAVAAVLRERERYRARIRVIAESFRTAGGPERAADRIEEFMGGA